MEKSTLLDRFKEYIAQHNLFTPTDKILLTVSGGVDSMVMLHLFHLAGYNVGVAHCNFQLRGLESEEDEVLVKNEADILGVECYNQRFATTQEMELTGESMEMAARRLRYQWFYELCDTHKYTAIAVAHHADDSIETFFINLLRGTGLRGLTGIHSQVGKVVRPLMFASRKEILEFAAIHSISYREDSSNRSTKYLRNKIRLGLIPRIREINSKFTALMGGNLKRLADAQLFINSAIAKIKYEVVEVECDLHTIHVDRIDAMFPLNFVLYEILNSVYGFKGDVVDSLYTALQNGSTGRRFYSRDWTAHIDRGNILIAPIAQEDSCTIEVAPHSLRSYCGNSVLYYEYIDIDSLASFTVPENTVLIDTDKLTYPLTLRRWRDGDWFVPFGMSGRKKVGDLLTDLKMSAPQRDRQFVLLSGDDIVWVVGLRADGRFALSRETENVVKITKEIV